MIASLSEVFYQVTGALLVPVMLLILLLFVVSLVGLGVHLGELVQRWRDRANRDRLAHILATSDRAENDSSVLSALGSAKLHGAIGHFVTRLRESSARIGALQNTLDAIEDDVERRINRATLLVRLGPTLGLMGTLIPMGPALKALANGDVEGMSGKLIIAFSTTVLGLAIGGLAVLIASVRRRWYTSDLRLCDALLAVVVEGKR